jgi:hypothetical protein
MRQRLQQQQQQQQHGGEQNVDDRSVRNISGTVDVIQNSSAPNESTGRGSITVQQEDRLPRGSAPSASFKEKGALVVKSEEKDDVITAEQAQPKPVDPLAAYRRIISAFVSPHPKYTGDQSVFAEFNGVIASEMGTEEGDDGYADKIRASIACGEEASSSGMSSAIAALSADHNEGDVGGISAGDKITVTRRSFVSPDGKTTTRRSFVSPDGKTTTRRSFVSADAPLALPPATSASPTHV